MLTRSDGISIACPRGSRLKRFIVQTSSLSTGFIGLKSLPLSSPTRENFAKSGFHLGAEGAGIPLYPAPLFQFDLPPSSFVTLVTIPHKMPLNF